MDKAIIRWLGLIIIALRSVANLVACPTGKFLVIEKSSISRNEVMSALHERGVATRPGTHALHILGYYKKAFDFSPSDFPNSLASAQNSMAIPLHNQMSSEDYEYVIQAINSLDV